MPRWQLLNPEGVVAMPKTGLPSSSLESPVERAKSGSP
jgi:hypothetical protein